MDRHVTSCVSSLIFSRKLKELRGGVTYGSSMALIPLQLADIIASCFRRVLDGQQHLMPLKQELEKLKYEKVGHVDADGYPINSIFQMF
jgi:hypothetical protein